MYLAGDGCDEDSDFGPDQEAGVTLGGNALGLDEDGELCFDIVIEDQAGQRPLKAVSKAYEHRLKIRLLLY